jgi:GNAT superfamily N-acetyltransferase
MLLEVAENANTYTPLGPHDERIENDRYVLWLGRHANWNVAQRFRLHADEVDEVRAEIHGILRERDRSECTWEVGTHATPGDLVDRLLALGLVDDEPDPHVVGMVLDGPPAQAPLDVEVRRASTAEEHFAASKIAAVAFGEPEPSEPVEPRPLDYPSNVVYLAYVGGEPVARASAAFGEHAVSLFGGATLPDARGRGAYRALVAARWEDAVARGTPVLVTQAGRMSRPILAQLGFRAVCEIRILLDRFE